MVTTDSLSKSTDSGFKFVVVEIFQSGPTWWTSMIFTVLSCKIFNWTESNNTQTHTDAEGRQTFSVRRQFHILSPHRGSHIHKHTILFIITSGLDESGPCERGGGLADRRCW